MSAARASKKSTATNSSKAANKAAPKKAAAKKSASKKATAKKAAAKKASAKKAAAKKTPAKKKAVKATSTTKKAAETKAAATETAASKPAAKSESAKAAPAKAAKAAPAKKVAPKLPKFLTDPAWLKGQRELLLQERGKYIQNAEALAAEAHSLMADREPGDVQFDEESGEGDTLAVERDRDLALSAKAREKVDAINNSLARIDAGTYGVCLSGEGDIIPKDRLEFIPEAAKCVQHQTSMF